MATPLLFFKMWPTTNLDISRIASANVDLQEADERSWGRGEDPDREDRLGAVEHVDIHRTNTPTASAQSFPTMIDCEGEINFHDCLRHIYILHCPPILKRVNEDKNIMRVVDFVKT